MVVRVFKNPPHHLITPTATLKHGDTIIGMLLTNQNYIYTSLDKGVVVVTADMIKSVVLGMI